MTTWFIVNHLWQSTCFAVLAGVLAWMLRKNSPKTRYWVWLSASLKFLLPFALLVSFGSIVPRPVRDPAWVAAPVFPNSPAPIVELFSPPPNAAVPAHAPWSGLPAAIGVVWALGFMAIMLSRCQSWRAVRTALAVGTPIELPVPVKALITPGADEPGIVGVLRPVLVLPDRLLEHLSPRQLDAILTHELCHVRRRDNFFAAVHMVVEAIFWFHPLVWWIGSHMLEERELACDEAVLQTGVEPTDYVEGLLKVCRFYKESPLPCVSGVTGADVKRRLRAILVGGIARELSAGKKAVLAAMGLAALAAPVAIGVLNAPYIRAQSATPAPQSPRPGFEVASIKPAPPDERRDMVRPGPGGGITITNLTLKAMIGLGWQVQPFQISGGPAWLDSARYDVVAKREGKPQPTETPLMIQSLLEERFQLAVHRETRELPIYALVLARKDGRLGPRLTESKEGSCTPADPTKPPPPSPTLWCGWAETNPRGELRAAGIRLSDWAPSLARLLGRMVVDKTGLTAKFDINAEWTPDERLQLPPGTLATPPSDTAAPSLFTAFQEQLGLRIESQKGAVEILVVDRAEKPSEN